MATNDIDKVPFIPARFYTNASRRKGDIRVIVIHDMEAPEKSTTAEAVAKWWNGPTSSRSSAHYCIDNDSTVRSVKDEDVAWHAPGANHDGIGLEMAGYAKQSRAEWLDAYSKAVIERTAHVTAQLCKRYGLNVKHLTNAELRAGHSGIVGHNQVSEVYKRSSHWDPGPNFPWDYFMERVRYYIGGASVPSSGGGGTVSNTISRGDYGAAVESWQRDLQRWNKNALPQYGADKDFGDETVEWTNKFFVASGLTSTPVDDPVVGPKSRERMKQVLEGASKPTPKAKEPDYEVVVLYREGSGIDEGMALVYGNKNDLKVLPFNPNGGPTYRKAFVVGAAAQDGTAIKRFIQNAGFEPRLIALSGKDRFDTARIVREALDRGVRNHPNVTY